MHASQLKRILDESSYTVCLLGLKTSMACGCLNYRQEDGVYDLEQKYGYSPEEIFSDVFYNTRPQQFFQFYQNELLSHLGAPDACMHSLASLESAGLIKTIITRELYSLAKRAGCKNVIELHGSVYDNKCPRCGETYDVEYVKKGNPVPLCKKCGSMLRPGVCLVGEQLDSGLIAKSAAEVEKADTLLVIGTHLKSSLASNCLPYFRGSHLILINDEIHPWDARAELVFREPPETLLATLMERYPESEEEEIHKEPTE